MSQEEGAVPTQSENQGDAPVDQAALGHDQAAGGDASQGYGQDQAGFMTSQDYGVYDASGGYSAQGGTSSNV